MISTFPSRHYDIEDYPAVKKYLLSIGKERLEQTGKEYIVNGEKIKARKKTNNKWFETQDSISYWEDFSRQKIVYREISTEMNACFIENEFFVNNKCYLITGESLEYLLCVLNSKLFNKFLLQNANLTGGKGSNFLKKILLPHISKKEQMPFIRLLKERMLVNDPSLIYNIEHEIDRLIYSYYNLTSAEIQIIENK